MKKIALIQTDSCVSCISLEHEVLSVMDKFKEVSLSVYRTQEEAQEIVDKYQVEKLPSLLLLDNDQLLGQVTGYQPAFILEVWLENLLKEGR
ncbi:MAG TPA: thioredoxin fold domain-containing protein [Erysipelothrix sp.]|jgi:thiol-disulfide isomerase/thioredoxin|nr:thioredoxin fold domain-containing protein [Erysipelothrix sp.]